MAASRVYLGVHYPSDVIAGAALGTALAAVSGADRAPARSMSTRIGIVGMPNAGKSSLFNALTSAGAEAANYPFTTIEPNVAVVPVRDSRLEQVAATVGASEIVWDTIDFHDIAGLVAGAHKGEGLGNKFLANIRETDAIVHVVRAHGDENVIHPEGSVDPLATSRRSRPSWCSRTSSRPNGASSASPNRRGAADRAAAAEEAWLREVIAELQAGRPVRGVPVPEEAPNAIARPRLADRQAGAVRGERRRGLRSRCRPRSPSTRPRRGRARWRSPRASSPSSPSSTRRRRRRCARR